MNNSLTFKSKAYTPEAGANWSNSQTDPHIINLQHRYEFLNDPDMKAQLVKIRKELQRTRYKVKRKKSDRRILFSFLVITTGILAWLTSGRPEIYIVGAFAFYSLLAILVFWKVLIPISVDIRYLNIKVRYLRDFKKETAARAERI